ncbi:MAG: PQQ-dependent sugar dehydrogenase, partial [Rhizobiales bacterium]|nr:PQQ-dependent sugar dehydrogenase [Hyphomicrobiales bacterium]
KWFNPSIGPGSVNFYTGDRFPGWKNSMFIPGMVGQKLIRIEVADRRLTSQELLLEGFGRLREVKTGPDGYLYLLVQTQKGDKTGGSIIRLTPS